MERILILKIDHREDPRLFKILQKENIEFKIEQLLVGDVIDEEKGICFERKEVGDLVNSISNNRIHVQLANMQKNFENNYLIIHGSFKELFFNPHFKKFTVSHKLGILSSISVRYKVKLIQVDNLNQFVGVMLKIIEKTDDGKNMSIPIRLEKKSSKDILTGILYQIPGLGIKRAGEISEKYKTLRLLQQRLEEKRFDVKGVGKKTIKAMEEVLL